MALSLEQIIKDRRLGKYRLKRKLGQGAMAVVFEAEDTLLQRPVALKVLLPGKHTGSGTGSEPAPALAETTAETERDEFAQTRKQARRLMHEARAAAALDHPAIVRIHELDEHDGLPYIAMERVDGVDLKRRLDEAGPLPVDEACHLVAQAARAVQYAHDRGVVHGDLKPANRIRTPTPTPTPTPDISPSAIGVTAQPGVDSADGSRQLAGPLAGPGVKITDFGVARRWQAKDILSEKRTFTGTPAFVSPQVARGEPATPASDIYSLGCTLYMLLTGKPVFQADSRRVVLKMQIRDPVPDVRDLRPDVPEAVAAVIRTATAKPPEQRYPSAAAFADALTDALTDALSDTLSDTLNQAIQGAPDASPEPAMPKPDPRQPPSPHPNQPPNQPPVQPPAEDDFSASLAALANAVADDEPRHLSGSDYRASGRPAHPAKPRKPREGRHAYQRRGVPWASIALALGLIVVVGGALMLTRPWEKLAQQIAEAEGIDTPNADADANTASDANTAGPTTPPAAAVQPSASQTAAPAPVVPDGGRLAADRNAPRPADATPPTDRRADGHRDDPPAPPIWTQPPAATLRPGQRDRMIELIAADANAGLIRCYAVQGRVTHAQLSPNEKAFWLFLDGYDQPMDTGSFYVVSFPWFYEALTPAFGDPAKPDRFSLLGKQVRIKGALVHYQKYGFDCPQIVLESPAQVEVID